MSRDSDEPHRHTPGCLDCALRDAYNGRSHSFTDAQLEEIACRMVDDPQNACQTMNDLFLTIYERDSHPVTSLFLVKSVLQDLAPLVARKFFDAELNAFLERHPPENRPTLRSEISNEIEELVPQLEHVVLLWIIEERTEKTVTEST